MLKCWKVRTTNKAIRNTSHYKEALSASDSLKYNFSNVKSVDRPNVSAFHRPVSTDNNKAFFIDSTDQKSKKVEEHHKNIKKVYEAWSNPPLYAYPTFNVLDPVTYSILYVGDIIPSISEENVKLPTAEQMAISHLNCEEYQKAYCNYLKIIELQKDFHNATNFFFTWLREHVSHYANSTEIDKESKINSLFDYYLHKIVDALPYQNFPYRLEHFEKIYEGVGREFSNPFPEREEEIKQDMFSIYTKVRDAISIFDECRKDLNLLILKFADSLKPVIDNDLKGSCLKEREFGSRNKLNFVFRKQRHVP